MANPYDVQFEVEGPAAMWTRPDTGSTPSSYPVPTLAAEKGMSEAVLRRPHVYVQPTLVEICENRENLKFIKTIDLIQVRRIMQQANPDLFAEFLERIVGGGG
jgi:CRISPR-associated Cas5-like protein